MKHFYAICCGTLLLSACSEQKTTSETHTPDAATVKYFPFNLPKEKPNIPLSASMTRVYENYGAAKPQDNELYTLFKFTPIKGLEYSNFDGKVTRRDPSRIIKEGDTYYMWYTYRNTPSAPVGPQKATAELPSRDWDLCDIGYATSKDGFTWEDQGVAVHRPEKPTLGYRSISTPEILVWKGKYYLYFQAFSVPSGTRGDDCPVAMAEADSPRGPWRFIDQAVLPNGAPGEWDQYSIHDPLPVVMNDKIYMYYKSDYNEQPDLIRSQGLAVADNPFGPFEKCKLNPVLSSGHETHFFRFKEGVAALSVKDGHEHNTIQYSEDGVNFHVASIINSYMPEAGAFYDPNAFTNVNFAPGVTWGVSHFNKFIKDHMHSIILRYDCDLSLDLDDPAMKKNYQYPSLDDLYRQGLSKKQRERILQSI